MAGHGHYSTCTLDGPLLYMLIVARAGINYQVYNKQQTPICADLGGGAGTIYIWVQDSHQINGPSIIFIPYLHEYIYTLRVSTRSSAVHLLFRVLRVFCGTGGLGVRGVHSVLVLKAPMRVYWEYKYEQYRTPSTSRVPAVQSIRNTCGTPSTPVAPRK